jgi:D-sedoheptulose 7-phosphate isomerase
MENIINEHLEVVESMKSLVSKIDLIADVIIQAYEDGNKVLIFGNGGSAVDSEHFTTELVSRFKFDREGLNAISLSSNVATLTAIGNDYDFDSVYSRQVKAYANQGDIVIGITTNGFSPNVIKGLEKAIELKCIPVLITGNKNIDNEYITLNINSNNTARIQEAYLLAIHMICEKVERVLFGEK